MRISDWSSDVCSSDLLFVAAVLAALAAAPLVVDDFILVLLVDILVLALFAASLHFLLSIGGLVSFGHAAFYGGGAYAAEVGRASGRERVGQYVVILVVHASFKKKNTKNYTILP